MIVRYWKLAQDCLEKIASFLPDPLLLGIRLYWGWQFFQTGKGKLMNLDNTTGFFIELGIPFPKLNAIIAGSTECFGGLLLLVGLASRLTAVPLILLNVKVKHKPDLNQIPDIQQAIKTAEATLNGSGRVLVRYSGTEALLRIMVEGERDSTIREVADHLASIVRARIG